MINTEEHNFTDSDAEGEHISLGEIISKYVYRWPLLVLGVLLSMSLVFIYLRYTKPVYQVNSSILIKDDSKSSSGGDILNQLDLFGNTKVVDNELEILQSRTLMRKVVDRLNLAVGYHSKGRVINGDIYAERPISFIVAAIESNFQNRPLELSFPDKEHYQLKEEISGKSVTGKFDEYQKNIFGTFKVVRMPGFDPRQKDLSITFKNPEAVNDDCLSNLNATIKNKASTVISLTYQETVPQRGKDILNTLIQVYNEAGLADKNKTTQSTIHFIDERLKLISGQLTDVEKDVEGFKTSHGLTDLSADASLFLENLKVNDQKLNDVNLQISVIKDVERYVESNSPHEKLPTVLGITDPVLLGQITQLSDLQLKKDQLLATTQPNNPLVEPLTKQIETTRAGIKTTVRNIASSLESTKKALSGMGAVNQASIKKMPGQEREFISIKRQQTLKETLYLYLLQKKEEAALSYASSVADSRLVDAAFYSNSPIAPKRPLTYLIGLIAGIVLPIIYIYILDLLNNKISHSSDVSKLTKVPVLGEILYEEGDEPIVVTATSRKAIAEQFRSIRTNLQFVYGKAIQGVGHVTLFTSSMSGEGKSFVASNLAAAMAISGRRTVLLELDLRKPKISKYLTLPNRTGLSNFLIGKAEIKDIIQRSGVNDNLHVIGSGPIPPNPSELLIHSEIEELITYLRANFDEIIIDTAPIGLVTDAQILARLADATIYLLRQNITFKKQVSQLEDLYRKNKFPKLNIVLNGVQLGGQYGYGYGYYSDDVEHKKVTFKSLLKNLFKRF